MNFERPTDPPGFHRQSFLKGCLAGLVAGAGAAVIVMLVVLRVVLPSSVWQSAAVDINRNRIRSDMLILRQALDAYKADFGAYPTQEQGLAALVDNPKRKYIGPSDVPVDPWERSYAYQAPGPKGQPYVIVTYGADGNPGGEGLDADIAFSP
jgi:general secretion pathway protein G